MTNTLTIVPSPDLVPAYTDNPATCVVIDILRASTTIVAALTNGAKCIYPLEYIEEAEQYAKEGKLVGAERNTLRCPFAQLGNDPLEYTPDIVEDKEVYFTTTNGTRTIKICKETGHKVLIGAFSNLRAVAKACKNQNILAVCAGWKGRVCTEDAMFAAALAEELADSHKPIGDSTRMTLELWHAHKHDLEQYLQDAEHYHRLVKVGMNDTIKLCLTPNTMECVPEANYDTEGMIRITAK